MSSEQKRIFLAVVISGIILVGWQMMFMPKPNPSQIQPATAIYPSPTPIPTPGVDIRQASIPQVVTEISDKNLNLSINEKVEILNIKPLQDLSLQDIFGNESNFFKIEFFNDASGIWEPVTFQFTQPSPDTLSGIGNANSSIMVKIENSEKVSFSINFGTEKAVRISMKNKPDKLETGLISSYVVYSKDSVTREYIGEEETVDGSTKWIGVDFKHYLYAIVFSEKIPSKITISTDGTLVLLPSQKFSKFTFYSYLNLKNYDELVAAGDNLHLSVDFGVLGIIAVPILKALQYCYKIIPNYGIGIIILTLFIRLLTFPLQYKSFKSMKKMQKLQPQMQAIKEKYKEDPQRMQKETMELFKKADANPFSGCLPLLLQMPIFFAFYTVLNNSVELVGAPFYFWLTDLSLKDPYYILPILMTITMVIQQKITPATGMDPVQQKIMLFMPIFFGFIMKDFASGLNLYMFVSTLFGIIQQYYVYKYSE